MSEQTGDFDALKLRAWALVEDAAQLVADTKGSSTTDRKSSLHAAKQVFELYGVLLDKHERGKDVERLKKQLDKLQEQITKNGLRKVA